MSRHLPWAIRQKALAICHCHRWKPRALNEDQIRSLKNLCDRLLPFYRSKNRKWLQSDGEIPLQAKASPWRDRAIVTVLLSTGLRREELGSVDNLS